MYKIGDIVQGVVTGIQPYGAFVQLDEAQQGLIHISECRSAFIKQVSDELTVGQHIEVMILDVDEYNHKLSLSQRSVVDKERLKTLTLEYKPNDQGYHHFWTNQHNDFGFATIEKNINASIEESLERLD
ncbi:CvfD/Ygs/GSP13 family RNA-binding post-transcriptional regulator [Weissella tructae]|uniref:General stress protein 13 n=2 Tax=Weissella TaxID=46255 RepID=A0A075TW85_9LACO|nr:MULTISPECIES: CvfD/Ygs/GSP13 family RNA-binding post-transcriptional regulator [Weissella]AIG65834.1 General stress protein 13 [Weissella tructae]AIM63213.1 General stress protein 13 [Weissella ceti]AIM64548.1 General stress protein 13 [Weissella ceti]ELA07205.1 RNA-binding protein [Weissella ceti NC36]QVV90993.1 S1 RNA-binding domain-containing protein [Weissella tructae]